MGTSFWLLSLLACGTPGTGRVEEGADPDPQLGPTTAVPDDFVPAPAALHRLTAAEYRNSVRALLGIPYDGALPLDYSLHGYLSVGASELSVGPVDLELYEAAAWALAERKAPDEAAVEAILGEPWSIQAVGEVLPDLLKRAWRRPATPDEIAALLLLADDVEGELGPVIAVRAVLAAVLVAPDFLFRVEEGTPDPLDPTIRRLTDWELAAKLSYFLVDGPPDEALLAAAEAGELTRGGLVDQAERLLATPEARVALVDWFDETLELARIEGLQKDDDLYPELADLRDDMRSEIRDLFALTAIDEGADLRDLLTRTTATASPELAAAVYGPGDAARGGLLGRAGLLAVGAHNTVTSPTHRGKLVRTRLLCGSVPPPPPGVVTELSSETEGSLRDRLQQHAIDPACSSCHDQMDPIGYGLEHFDPMGRYRTTDEGYAIDATGELDGVTFDGAVELGAAVAAHPEFPFCMTAQMYRAAMGHAETWQELGAIHGMTDVFVADGHRLDALVQAIVGGEAFQLVGAPGAACADGDTRSCATDCGEGVEACLDGAWMACSAPSPSLESCNGADDDCDGAIDELPECAEPPDPVEVCNGADDDNDGQVDEGLEVAVVATSPAALAASHGSCDAASGATWNGPCNAAVHRLCEASACAVTGFGPVDLAADEVVCLDASEGVVVHGSFTALSAVHADCHAGATHGGPCNAAISRSCAAAGLTTGYGPVENSGDAAVYVCTPGATVIDGSYATLSTFEPLCDGFAERWGPTCSAAIHAFCVDAGYEAGHGPLENSGDLAVIACLGGN